jgi:hypothetical protein
MPQSKPSSRNGRNPPLTGQSPLFSELKIARKTGTYSWKVVGQAALKRQSLQPAPCGKPDTPGKACGFAAVAIHLHIRKSTRPVLTKFGRGEYISGMCEFLPYKTTLLFEPFGGQNCWCVESYCAHLLKVAQSLYWPGDSIL